MPKIAAADAPLRTPANAMIINPYQNAPSLDNNGANGNINKRIASPTKQNYILNLSLNLLPIKSILI